MEGHSMRRLAQLLFDSTTIEVRLQPGLKSAWFYDAKADPYTVYVLPATWEALKREREVQIK